MTKNENPLAVGYIRVSTGAQANNGVSLKAQEAMIRAWATANRYDLAHVYEDAGLSGGRADNRPGLQSALTHCCKHKSALVVYSLSRLARSTKDAITISERLSQCGADLVSLSEKLDTTSAAGKMIFRLLAVLAEFERDQISERTSAALQHMKRNGKRIGAVPYGFDLADDGTSLLPNKQERDFIAKMKWWRRVGHSYGNIADRLNRMGVLTKTGRGKWHPRTVQMILRGLAEVSASTGG